MTFKRLILILTKKAGIFIHVCAIALAILIPISFKSQSIFQARLGTPTYSEAVGIIFQTAQGDFYLGGRADSMITLTKLDQNGSAYWSKYYVGSIWISPSARKLSDGNILFYGTIEKIGGDNMDLFLMKVDLNGSILWSKIYTPNLGFREEGCSVEETPDGGILLYGNAFVDHYNNSDLVLIKTDSNGNIVWQKEIGTPAMENAAGIIKCSEGGYLISGTAIDNYGDIFLMKLDDNANIVWSKIYNAPDRDYGGTIMQISDGSYLMTGGTLSYSGSWDIYAAKFKNNGDFEWIKIFGDPLNNDGYGGLLQTPKKEYYFAGETGSLGNDIGDGILIKTDSLGNLIFSKSYRNRQRNAFGGIISTTDGGLAFAGVTWNDSEEFEGYLIKTDIMGNSGCFERDSTILSYSYSLTTSIGSFTVTNSNFTAINHTFSALPIGTVTPLCFSEGLKENDEKLNKVYLIKSLENKVVISELTIPSDVSVIDLNGNLIYKRSGQLNFLEIETSQYSPGIYLLKIEQNGRIWHDKILIR